MKASKFPSDHENLRWKTPNLASPEADKLVFVTKFLEATTKCISVLLLFQFCHILFCSFGGYLTDQIGGEKKKKRPT